MVTGLLERAAAIRRADPRTLEAEGVSPEDRREILEHIEKVVSSNKINFSDSRYAFKAARSGMGLPAAVALLVAAAAAGVVYYLSVGFEVDRAESSRSSARLASAEGTLLRELRQESDERLKEKDAAISELRGRLADLDREKAALGASFDDRLRGRESELRAAMEAELARERARLTAEGLSPEAVAERMKRFEAEKEAELARELSAFDRRLAEERAAAEERLARLRDEYRERMAGLGEERKKLQEESERRVSALRATLEKEKGEAEKGLEAAREKLAALEAERRAGADAEARIVGLYALMRTALSERRFSDAAAAGEALRTLLDDPSIASLPALRARRAADAFAAEYLSRYAASEAARAGVDAALVSRQAESVSLLRDKASQARSAAAAGDARRAEALYEEALAVIPDALEARRFIASREAENAAAKAASASAALDAALSALEAGKADQAAALFAEALASSVPDDGRGARLFRAVAAAGAAEAASAEKAADARLIRPALAEGRAAEAARDWPRAVAAYAGAAALYPRADAVREARERLAVSVEAWKADQAAAASAAERESREREAALARQTEDLRASLEKSAAAIEDAKALGKAALVALAEEKDARIADLEERLAQAAGSGSQRTQASAEPAVDPAALRDLKAAAARWADLKDEFASYASADDKARSEGGPASAIRSRTALDEFLDGPAAREALPGLRERVAAYEAEYSRSAQTEGLANAASLAASALRIKDASARDRFIAEAARRYAGDPAMASYLSTLRTALSTSSIP